MFSILEQLFQLIVELKKLTTHCSFKRLEQFRKLRCFFLPDVKFAPLRHVLHNFSGMSKVFNFCAMCVFFRLLEENYLIFTCFSSIRPAGFLINCTEIIWFRSAEHLRSPSSQSFFNIEQEIYTDNLTLMDNSNTFGQ